MEETRNLLSGLSEDEKLSIKTLVVLNKATKTMHRHESEFMKRYGLSLFQFGVLEALYSKGAMNIQSIIDSMLSSSGNMTVVIRNLERDGYLIRAKDPKDKRSILIDLSAKGKEIIELVWEEHVDNICRLMSVLTRQEKISLIDSLKKFKSFT